MKNNLDFGSTTSIEGLTKSNFREILYKYISYWKLFFVLIFFALCIANLYLRYKVPMYEAFASIKVIDNQKGGSGVSETSAFDDLSILKDGNSIENEKAILTSRDLMRKVVVSLGLQIEYYAIGNLTGFTRREIYHESPILLEIEGKDSLIRQHGNSFFIHIITGNSFQLETKDGKILNKGSFNQRIKINKFISYKFSKNHRFSEVAVNRKIEIVVLPIEACVNKCLSTLKIEQSGNASAILKLFLQNQSKEKAINILNMLVRKYNEDAIEDKNLVSKNTCDFINDRVKYISKELGDVEDEAKRFKEKNKLVDVEVETKAEVNAGTDLRMSIIAAETQVQLSKMMLEHLLANSATDDLVPVNLGLADNTIERTIEIHNNLVLERLEELKTTTTKAPKVVNLTNRISELKTNIEKSVRNLINSKKRALVEIDSEERRLESELAKMPRFEKEFRSIERQQQIKESLYLYLLQKREETQIALAVGIGNAKLVDSAYSNGSIISPKRSFIYLGALSLSIVLGILYIYIKDLLYDKVYSKSDIEKLNLPFIGNIPLGDKNKQIVVTKGSKTAISEAFRSLRTNVDFMLGQVEGRGKFIFITSTVAREGKSFTAVNFSISLALSGKKVLLIGMDLRAPKLEDYMGKERSKGVTNFIVDSRLTLADLIYTTDIHEKVDILPSGDIPPNPSELLMSERVVQLFQEVGQLYDYMVVDTAPVGIVTDTLLISKYADTVLYVVRAHELPKRMLNIPSELKKEERLPNMALLLNGTYGSKGYGYGYGYRYGYGYGYGYYQEDKKAPWWKFNLLFKKS